MAKLPQADRIPWQDMPVQKISHAAALTGGSASRVYALIGAGELEAVKLAGKTSLKRRRSSLFSIGARSRGSPT